ncbi:MAG: peptidoglycan-binding domain-containing protein [Verrucomicrobiae bacterium]|nr:peptidoglycan-binding domain-containing protein [Verrucomicrobiae bacterium]
MKPSLFFSTIIALLFSCSHPLLAANTILTSQQVLSRLGYYKGPMDGSAGSGTSAAIRRFQVANHLRPTGTLTPETEEALGIAAPTQKRKISSFKPQSYLSPSVQSDPKALADLFVGGPLLAASPEIQVATIQRAQENLKILGYYSGPINGTPDANLKAALLAYQRDSKFKRSGRLDKITLMGLDILPGVYQSGN